MAKGRGQHLHSTRAIYVESLKYLGCRALHAPGQHVRSIQEPGRMQWEQIRNVGRTQAGCGLTNQGGTFVNCSWRRKVRSAWTMEEI